MGFACIPIHLIDLDMFFSSYYFASKRKLTKLNKTYLEMQIPVVGHRHGVITVSAETPSARCS